MPATIKSVQPAVYKINSTETISVKIKFDAAWSAGDGNIVCHSSDENLRVQRVVTPTPTTTEVTLTVNSVGFLPGSKPKLYFTHKFKEFVVTFEVLSASVGSMAFNNNPIASGGSTTLTVTLSSAANVGGTLVRLTQDRETNFRSPILLGLPPALVIASGLLTGSVTVTGVVTTTRLTDTVRAAVSGVGISTVITVG